MTPSISHSPVLNPVRVAATGRLHWRALSRAGRVAATGVAASAALAIALSILIPRVTHDHTLGARLEAMGSMVRGLERGGVIPSVDEHLTGDAYDRFDAIVRDGLLGGENIRVKLWNTDGEVVYSDDPAQVGERHPVAPDLAGALGGSATVSHTRLDEAENRLDRSLGSEAFEFYVPLRARDGTVIGAFEIYQDARPLLSHLRAVTTTVRLSVATGLTILFVFLIMLFQATARAIWRQQLAAEARAEDLQVLLRTSELLSSQPHLDETAPTVLRLVATRLMLSCGAVLFDGNEPEFAWTPTSEPGVCDSVVEAVREAKRRGRTVELTGRCAVERHGSDPACVTWGVPIQVEPDHLGSLAACREASRPFQAAEIALLNGVAGQLAVAAEGGRAFADLRRTTEIRGELLRQLVGAQEEERRHLVGEFHDQTGQTLTRVLYGLRGSRIRLGPDLSDISDELERLEGLVDELIGDLRRYMTTVRPALLEDFGLAPALEAFAREQELESGFRVVVDADDIPAVDPATAITLFRAAQEAVMNARKHAEPRNVRIDLGRREGAISLRVMDDGRGTEELRDGVGLTYLRQRVASLGGSVDVVSHEGSGTTVAVDVPWRSGA